MNVSHACRISRDHGQWKVKKSKFVAGSRWYDGMMEEEERQEVGLNVNCNEIVLGTNYHI